MAGEIARLFVTIGAKTEEFDKAISDLQDKMDGFTKGLSDFGTNATKYVTLPIVAIAGILGTAAIKAGEYADGLMNLSAETGINTDQLQKWRFMAGVANTDADILATTLSKINQQMVDGTEFGKKLEGAAEDLGVALRDASGFARDGADIINDLLLVLADIEDPLERARVGTQLFGDQWGEIAPIVDLGTEAIRNFNNQEVISQEQLEKAAQLTEAMALLKEEVGLISTEMAIEFTPAVQEITDILREYAIPKIKETADAFIGLSDDMQLNILKWVGIAAIIGPAAKALTGVITLAGYIPPAFSAVVTAVKLAAIAVGVSAGVMLGWIALIVAAIWAAVEAWKALKRLAEGGPIAPGLKGDNIGVNWDKNTQSSSNTWGIHGFDTGGIVPGPIGRPRLALVHGGETILPTHKMQLDTAKNVINNITVEKMQVRDEADIQHIAKELYRLQRRRDRGV